MYIKVKKTAVSDDPIDKIISKFPNHPRIKMINDNVTKGKFSFCIVSIPM